MSESIIDNNTTPQPGTDPKQTENTANNTSTLDLTKISDEEFAKVFEDPRLFKHNRFKELTDAKRERDELKSARQKEEEDTLKKNQEFEKLANLKTEEANKAIEESRNAKIDVQIIQAAASKGAVDLEAVKALINRGNIKIDGDGSVIGVSEAIETLAKDKAYLFDSSNGQRRIGGGTGPANGNNTTQTFTLTQMQDAKFFREHEKEIRQAMKAGTIIDDRGQSQGPRR